MKKVVFLQSHSRVKVVNLYSSPHYFRLCPIKTSENIAALKYPLNKQRENIAPLQYSPYK